MKKREVLEAFINIQKKKIRKIKESSKSIRQAAIEAPSSKETHSDTSKFQYSSLSSDLEKKIAEAEEHLNLLKALQLAPNDVIAVGSIFSLKNTEEVDNYFLVSKDGGDLIKIGEVEITSISEQAPLAKTVIGRKRSDKIMFRDKIFEVIEVQ